VGFLFIMSVPISFTERDMALRSRLLDLSLEHRLKTMQDPFKGITLSELHDHF